MADRLHERIRAMVPPHPPGTGLVVLKNQLVDKEIPISLRGKPAPPSRDLEAGYLAGRRAGDRVSLNRGLRGGSEMVRIGTTG